MKASARSPIAVVACVSALVFNACGGDDDAALDPTAADTEPPPTAATTEDAADPTATTHSPAGWRSINVRWTAAPAR